MAIISKDEDFLHLTERPGAGVQLVWVRLGNCRKAILLSTIERLWPKIEASLKAGETILEGAPWGFVFQRVRV